MANENKHHIIKRVIKKGNKHHGGQWKIAYADFVTAMMAFFLLMWLLSLLNKYQREGIAEYFKKPLKDVFTQPQIVPAADKYPGAAPNTKSENTLVKIHALQKHLQQQLDNDPQMSQYKNQLNFIITSDGLKIELKDLKDKPMFSEGKTDFKEHAETILAWLSTELNAYPNQVVIVGHTDSVPYPNSNNYSNWELSADRANATRRALIDYGMDDKKIIRIMGAADTELLNKQNGEDSENRRIEIIILTDEAAKRMREE